MGRRARRAVLLGQLAQQRVVLEVRELGGHPESLLPRPEPGREPQRPAARIEAVLPVAVAEIAHLHGDAVPLGQVPLEPGTHLSAAQPDPGREQLGLPVEFVHVVVPAVEVLAHLLVRFLRVHAPRDGAVPDDPGDLLGRRTVAALKVQQEIRDLRHPLREFAEVPRRHPPRGHLLAERLVQVRGEPRLSGRREVRRVDAEGGRQAQQHRHRHRPCVVLELVEVARGYGQFPGEGGLAHAALLAQPAQASADEASVHA